MDTGGKWTSQCQKCLMLDLDQITKKFFAADLKEKLIKIWKLTAIIMTMREEICMQVRSGNN